MSLSNSDFKIGLIAFPQEGSTLDALESWLQDAITTETLIEKRTVTHSPYHIEEAIRDLSDHSGCDLIFTVGGVGLSKNDNVASTVLSTVSRPLTGVVEQMHRILSHTSPQSIYLTLASGLRETPMHTSLIVTLPSATDSIFQILGGYRNAEDMVIENGLLVTLPYAINEISGCSIETSAEIVKSVADCEREAEEKKVPQTPTPSYSYTGYTPQTQVTHTEPIRAPIDATATPSAPMAPQKPISESESETPPVRGVPLRNPASTSSRFHVSAQSIARRSVQHGVPLFAEQRVRRPAQTIDFIVDEPEGVDDPPCTVIWLHGMGSSPEESKDLAQAIRQAGGPQARFIFPRAPEVEITAQGGARCSAWYDVLAQHGQKPEDEKSIKQTYLKISQLVNQVVAQGISSERIFLGGFSQGAAMALYCGLRQARTLAGVIALSGYLPAPELVDKDITPAGKMTPCYMAHGAFDSVINPMIAKQSAKLVESKIDTLIWREYDMDHEVCPDEMKHIVQFMNTALSI